MTLPVLAAFVTPAALAVGLGAASIPVLIHLLARRRFRRIRWAAMEFLLEAERHNRRRLRLEEWILLALRCLAVFLIGLLFARWYVQPEGLAAALGGTTQTQRIVVLDDSFSMGARAGDTTRFGLGKAALGRLAQWVQQESPQDTLSVFLASQPTQPLMADRTLREGGLDVLNTALAPAEPSQRGACMRESLDAVRAWLDAHGTTINAAVYVISDFQAREWLAPASDADAENSPLASLADWNDTGRSLRVVLLDVGQAEVENTVVTSLVPSQAQVVTGVPARFTATIAHHGRRAAEPTTLRVYVGQVSRAPVPVPRIEPGQTITVPIEVSFPNAGAESLSVELPDDALPIDNRRHLAVDVLRHVRVLLVNGEPDTEVFNDEVALLAAALRPDGPVDSGNEIEVIDENTLEDINLGGYHVVILANVYRITEAVAQQLERFAEAGGGVLFFVGDQVDPDIYNRLLVREGAGLLPAPLGDVIEAPASGPGFAFTDPDLTHALWRPVAAADLPFFEGIVTSRFLACAVEATSSGPATRPAIGASETAGAVRSATRTLLAYDDADRHPALLECTFGQGRVVLCTTTADKEWTNLPDRFAFVVLMQDLVQAIARRGDEGTAAVVGSPIVLDLEPGRYEPRAVVRTPVFPVEPDVTIDARPTPGGTMQLTWTHTAQSGAYRFDLHETGGPVVARLAAVNVDPLESDLAHADPDRLRQFGEAVPIEYVAGDAMMRDASADARTELWPTVLLLIVAVLMVEHALAWWFGSRAG
ncbi:MAG: BatA domain-containing protein [Phycisphaerae bacterium]|nr:BatA domain-containing protein [Phycisphaerae bacterium]